MGDVRAGVSEASATYAMGQGMTAFKYQPAPAAMREWGDSDYWGYAYGEPGTTGRDVRLALEDSYSPDWGPWRIQELGERRAVGDVLPSANPRYQPTTWGTIELELARRYLKNIGDYNDTEIKRAGGPDEILGQARSLRPAFPGPADWAAIRPILEKLSKAGARDRMTAIKLPKVYATNAANATGLTDQYGMGYDSARYAITREGLAALAVMPHGTAKARPKLLTTSTGAAKRKPAKKSTKSSKTAKSGQQILIEKAHRAGTAAKPEAERRADLARFLSELTPEQRAEVAGEMRPGIKESSGKNPPIVVSGIPWKTYKLHYGRPVRTKTKLGRFWYEIALPSGALVRQGPFYTQAEAIDAAASYIERELGTESGVPMRRPKKRR